MFLHQNTIIHHYYHLQAPMVGGVKRKPHQGPKVQAGYMQALNKLVSDECDTIRQRLID